jgi:hypothetical protein
MSPASQGSLEAETDCGKLLERLTSFIYSRRFSNGSMVPVCGSPAPISLGSTIGRCERCQSPGRAGHRAISLPEDKRAPQACCRDHAAGCLTVSILEGPREPGARAFARGGRPVFGSLAPVEFVCPVGSATKRDATDRRRAGRCIDETRARVDELQCERVIASCDTVG